VVVGVAIGLGVHFGMRRKNNKNNNTPPSTDGPNDPSNFSKDPNLKNAFYGIAYQARWGPSVLRDRIVQQIVEHADVL
jgi:hypothetical protein